MLGSSSSSRNLVGPLSQRTLTDSLYTELGSYERPAGRSGPKGTVGPQGGSEGGMSSNQDAVSRSA